VHANLRVQDDVGTHDAADGPGRSEHGDGARWAHGDLESRRGQAAQQVENHEADVAH
jgi:hypothetical protein